MEEEQMIMLLIRKKEICCTFENIMSTAMSDDNFDNRYINNMLYENGV
jgi:hypothetical protein